MSALDVNLRQDEEILSEAQWAVLTNQRLVAALNRKDRSEITDEAELSDVVSFKKSNGGQESRMRPGTPVPRRGRSDYRPSGSLQ